MYLLDFSLAMGRFRGRRNRERRIERRRSRSTSNHELSTLFSVHNNFFKYNKSAVINLSNRNLNNQELLLLSYGPKFVPNMRYKEFNHANQSLVKFMRNVLFTKHFILESRHNPNYQPKNSNTIDPFKINNSEFTPDITLPEYSVLNYYAKQISKRLDNSLTSSNFTSFLLIQLLP